MKKSYARIVCLRRPELLPGWPAAAGRRVDAGLVQDLPDGAGRDLVPQAGHFTVHAATLQVGFSAARRSTRSRSCRCQRNRVPGVKKNADHHGRGIGRDNASSTPERYCPVEGLGEDVLGTSAL